MGDFPENLNIQNIKREPSPQSPEERTTPYDIKAKLNLHVKRRLQDHPNDDTTQESHSIIDNSKQHIDRPKEIRQKRPYHKRTDKAKQAGTSLTTTVQLPSSDTSTSTPQQRKYKPKSKQVTTTDSQDDNSMPPNLNSGAEEDDAGHDNDLRPGREKEKCPDVLAMVLSMKKRALIQDPEVQKFLAEVINVIK